MGTESNMSPTPWQWFDGDGATQGQIVAAGALFQAAISARYGRLHWSLWTGGTILGSGPALTIQGGKIAVAARLATYLAEESERVEVL